MVKAEKATARKVYKVKNLAKLVSMVELGSTKKLPKMPKGEREETSKPLNLESGQKGASTEKECSTWESSKDSVQVVEQLWSTSDSLKSNEEEEKKNSKILNISKKPIKTSKWMEES